jgi:hypothetical protein
MPFFSPNAAVYKVQSGGLHLCSSWALLAALSMALFGSSCSRDQQPKHGSTGNRANPEVALPFSAEMWLKWDKPSRIAFLMGYLRGHWDGVGAGCADAKRAVRSLPGVSGFTPEAADEMWMHCGTNYKPSSRAFASYEEVVTNFYTRYPEDRIVEVPDVLLLLAPDSELTADDIHKSIKITQNPKR